MFSMFWCCAPVSDGAETVKVYAAEDSVVFEQLDVKLAPSIEEGSMREPEPLPFVLEDWSSDESDSLFGSSSLEAATSEPALELQRQLSDRDKVEAFDFAMQQDGQMGVQLLVKPVGLLTVANVGDGSFAVQNATASKKVRPHDVIVKVNGKSGYDAMLEEVRLCVGQVTFSIARPPVIEVTISKHGKPLGVGVDYRVDSQSFDIMQIHSGALKDFIASAAPQEQIAVGDCIVSINNISGSCEQMLRTLRASKRVKLRVVRTSMLAQQGAATLL